jgi:hypothetical protein
MYSEAQRGFEPIFGADAWLTRDTARKLAELCPPKA